MGPLFFYIFAMRRIFAQTKSSGLPTMFFSPYITVFPSNNAVTSKVLYFSISSTMDSVRQDSYEDSKSFLLHTTQDGTLQTLVVFSYFPFEW